MGNAAVLAGGSPGGRRLVETPGIVQEFLPAQSLQFNIDFR